jgi:hypothetical protein
VPCTPSDSNVDAASEINRWTDYGGIKRTEEDWGCRAEALLNTGRIVPRRSRRPPLDINSSRRFHRVFNG